MNDESYVSGEQRMEAAVPPESVNSNTNPEQEQREQYVPLKALQSERSERQRMEEELRLIKDHLSLLQASQNQQSRPKPEDDFEGLSDSDVMTVGEFKKVANKFTQQMQMSVEELRMTQKYPDYQEVVTKYLPEVIKTNPSLTRTLQATQDYELAYYLAKNSDLYKSEVKRSQVHSNAQRIVENSQKAGSLSSMGATSPISMAKRYKDMSDDDFRREVSRNMGYT